MKRHLLIAVTIAALAVPALAFGGPTATTTVTVEPSHSNSFAPANVTSTVGAGSIHWQWDTNGHTQGDHNVRQDDKLFFSGRATNSKPAGFTVVPSAGSFHYYCELHGTPQGGMVGVIKVRPQIINKTATSFGVVWSPGSNQTGNAFDVRYRVDGGKWTAWKNHTAGAKASFGLNGAPVTVRPGHTYDIQARSEKSSDLTKRSDWSPTARVRT
jgi:plastocyanin